MHEVLTQHPKARRVCATGGRRQHQEALGPSLVKLPQRGEMGTVGFHSERN